MELTLNELFCGNVAMLESRWWPQPWRARPAVEKKLSRLSTTFRSAVSPSSLLAAQDDLSFVKIHSHGKAFSAVVVHMFATMTAP